MAITERTSSEASAENSNAPVMIQNAGLVLFNPFLDMLFSMCGYLHEHKFKDQVSGHRAVLLLQYLATGHEHTDAKTLILNRILCGIPVHEPIDEPIALVDEEKELCHKLLKTVISRWPILGQTSPEGLQSGFIIREGSLSHSSDPLSLTVAHRQYDMLLKMLPWGFSVVKLHWMSGPLYVNWE